MGRRRVVVCLVLAACGRGGFDEHDAGGDGIGSGSAGTWKSLAAGNVHFCGIRADSTLACWGRNDYGELGLGDPAPPEADVPTSVDASSWKSVSVGVATTCAIRTDQSLWCWGYNFDAQIGDGTTTDRHTPTQVPGTWTSVAVGERHTCAIDSSTMLYCWGTELSGELGDGANTNVQPAPIAISTGWSTVIAGYLHTCALKADGTLWCWGIGAETGLGTNALFPTQVGSDTWLAVSSGIAHTCGVRSDGRLRCWGPNPYGEIGDGTTSAASTPVAVGQDQVTDWIAVGAGDHHTCAVRSDQSLWCWGDNEYGQLVADTSPFSFQSTPIMVSGGQATSLALGSRTTCALGPNQAAYCAGLDVASRRLPVQVPGTWAKGTAGMQSTCALDAAQLMHCWGNNTYGQLGDGTLVARNSPASFPSPAGDTWSSLAMGQHACAFDGLANLYCWGRGDKGEIGDGTTTAAHPTPTIIQPSAWIASTMNHTCSIDAGANLTCWGQNNLGQTGVDPASSVVVATPTAVAGFWRVVGAGDMFSCAIDSTNHVQCWGDNSYGQLGDGTSTSRYTPAMITNTSMFTDLTVGGSHACALDGASQWWCWGSNQAGELGDQTTTAKSVAQKLLAPASPMTVSAGYAHTCAVGADRSLWCWGSNAYGQLGDGSLLDRHQATRVGTDSDWSYVYAGYRHTCAMKTNGTLWCWGRDLDGEVGDGTAFRTVFALVQ